MSHQRGNIDIDICLSSMLLLTYGDALTQEEMDSLIEKIEIQELYLLSNLMN